MTGLIVFMALNAAIFNTMWNEDKDNRQGFNALAMATCYVASFLETVQMVMK